MHELETKLKLLEDPENTREKITQRAIESTQLFREPHTKEGFIYLLKSFYHKNNAIKPGETNNLQNRLKTYKTTDPNASFLYSKQCVDVDLAEYIIKTLLDHVIVFNKHEYFYITDATSQQLVDTTTTFIIEVFEMTKSDIEKLRSEYILNSNTSRLPDFKINKQMPITDYLHKYSENIENNDIIEDDDSVTISNTSSNNESSQGCAVLEPKVLTDLYDEFRTIKTRKALTHIHSKTVYNHFVNFLREHGVDNIPNRQQFRAGFPEKYFSTGVTLDGKRSNGYKGFAIV